MWNYYIYFLINLVLMTNSTKFISVLILYCSSFGILYLLKIKGQVKPKYKYKYEMMKS